MNLAGMAAILLAGSAMAQKPPSVMNSNFLNTTPPTASATPIPKTQPGPGGDKKNQSASSRMLQEGAPVDAKEIQKTKALIKSLDLIVDQLPSGVNRTQIVLNRAAARIKYARAVILNSKEMSVPEDAKAKLTGAIQDCDQILTSGERRPDALWKAHDSKGLALLYLNNTSAASASFIEALKLRPPPERAGKIALIIAEDLFERGLYAEAAEYYSKYAPNMASKWRELAIYKLAWCNINLNRPEEAEKRFSSLLGTLSVSGVSKDAIRDLAFMATHQKNVPENLKRMETTLIPPALVPVFLAEVRPNLEAAGMASVHAQTVERLLQGEKNPEKRLEFVLADIRVQRRPEASLEHLGAFNRLGQALKPLKKNDGDPLLFKFKGDIENEFHLILKSFLDTFAGRMRLDPSLTKEQVAGALKEFFALYQRFYPGNKNIQQIMTLWLDLCSMTKDYACTHQATEVVIGDPSHLQPLSERSYLEQIAAIENIALKEQGNSSWQEKRKKRIREFVSRFPESKQWLKVAQVHSQIEIDSGREKATLPLLDSIVQRSLTDDNFYRLQFARHKTGFHEAVISDERGRNFIQSGSKVIELYRESALALALKAKSLKDLEGYRRSLGQFYGFCTDQDKRIIARLDFLNFLIVGNKRLEAIEELTQTPAPDCTRKELDPLRSELWLWAIEDGELETALNLAKISQAQLKTPDWNLRSELSRRFLGYQPEPSMLRALSPQERTQVLEIMALTRPDLAIAYGKTLKKADTDQDRIILALAHRVHNDQKQLKRTPELETLLGKTYPFAEGDDAPRLPVELEISRIKIPDLKRVSVNKQAKLAQTTIAQVQNSRNSVVEGIRNVLQVQKVRTLNLAAELETATARMLLESPLPKNLTPAQADEYKSGIAAAAKEFEEQSSRYRNLIMEIKKGLEQESARLEARSLPSISDRAWPWPNSWSREFRNIKKLHEEGKTSGALWLLEFHRSSKLKESSDYFLLRTGVLLGSKSTNAALRAHLLNELEANGQDRIIALWAKAAARPIPERNKP